MTLNNSIIVAIVCEPVYPVVHNYLNCQTV